MRILLLFIACLCNFSISIFGQNARREASLAEVVEMAVANSGALKKAAIDREALEKQILEGKSGIFPKIEAGLNFDAYPVLPTQLIPGEYLGQPGEFVAVQFGQPWQLGVSLTAQQNLYSESARRAAPLPDASRAMLDILKIRTTQELRYSTAQLFLQTLQTRQVLSTIEANIEKLASLEKMLTLQQKNEYATLTDVKKVRVAKTNLEFQKQNLLAGISTLERTLAFFCGGDAEIQISPVLKVENAAADSTFWLAMIFDPGLLPEMHLAQKSQDLNRLQTKIMRGEAYPVVSAYAAGSFQTQRDDANFFDGSGRWFPMAAIGLRVKAPIFDGFRLKNKVAQSDFQWLKLEEDRKQLLAVKKLEFDNALSKYRIALRSLSIQQENEDLANEILEKTKLQYKEGTLAFAEVLAAQTAQVEASVHFWQQVYNLELSKLELAKTAGRLEVYLK